MAETIIELLIYLMIGYAGTGLVFAIPFLLFGINQIDPAARGGSFWFKVVIIPGVAAFWPYLVFRWFRQMGPPEESSPHRRIN